MNRRKFIGAAGLFLMLPASLLRPKKQAAFLFANEKRPSLDIKKLWVWDNGWKETEWSKIKKDRLYKDDTGMLFESISDFYLNENNIWTVNIRTNYSYVETVFKNEPVIFKFELKPDIYPDTENKSSVKVWCTLNHIMDKKSFFTFIDSKIIDLETEIQELHDK